MRDGQQMHAVQVVRDEGGIMDGRLPGRFDGRD